MNTDMADKLDDDQDDAPSDLLDSSIEMLLDPNTQQMMSEVRKVRRKVSYNNNITLCSNRPGEVTHHYAVLCSL